MIFNHLRIRQDSEFKELRENLKSLKIIAAGQINILILNISQQ